MLSKLDAILWLQKWYYSQCDGDWEHDRNIIISTIDNPGWSVTIKLEGTVLENHKYVEYCINNTDLDWYNCRIKDNVFKGGGGPYNLLDIIHVFQHWVEKDDHFLEYPIED